MATPAPTCTVPNYLKKATTEAWATRGGGQCYTGILPRTQLEGTHTRSIYAAIRLSTLRGGQDWKALREKLASEDEVSVRDMVRTVARARVEVVTPHLKRLEATVVLTTKERKFLRNVAMEWTLPQRAVAGEVSATGSTTTVDNRRKISNKLTCEVAKGIRYKVEQALMRAGLMDGKLSDLVVIMSKKGLGPQTWHTDYQRRGGRGHKPRRSVFLGLQGGTKLDYTQSDAKDIAAGKAKEETLEYGDGDIIVMEDKQAHRGAKLLHTEPENRRVFFYMTQTGVGPEDEDSQPITFPYDKAGYAEVVKDALAEEGKVKGGGGQKRGRDKEEKKETAKTKSRGKRAATMRTRAARDKGVQEIEHESSDSDSEGSESESSSESGESGWGESSEESDGGSEGSTSEGSDMDEDTRTAAEAIDRALQKVRTEKKEVRHTKAAMKKAMQTARSVQRKMAAGLEKAHGGRYHRKINKVKWIKCVGAIQWEEKAESGTGTAELIKTHGTDVVSAEVSEGFEWGRDEPKQTKLDTTEIRKYVRGAKSGGWHVYKAKQKWHGEVWIKVVTCQPAITWGLDRHGREAAVMVMEPIAGAGLVHGTKNGEVRSTTQIGIAASEGECLTYVAYKEGEAQWLPPGVSPTEEDKLFEIEPTKLVVDLTT